MDGKNILKTAFLLVFLVVCQAAESKWMPVPPVISHRPLCTSQFTLVNHACAFLPFTPTPHHHPPPSPQSNNHHGRRRRQRRHRRHRGRHHHESPVQQDCCRWLKEVDDECVCDLLVHLPPFLSRPLHQYTVMVDDTCSVTFQCGSRIKV